MVVTVVLWPTLKTNELILVTGEVNSTPLSLSLQRYIHDCNNA